MRAACQAVRVGVPGGRGAGRVSQAGAQPPFIDDLKALQPGAAQELTDSGRDPGIPGVEAGAGRRVCESRRLRGRADLLRQPGVARDQVLQDSHHPPVIGAGDIAGDDGALLRKPVPLPQL